VPELHDDLVERVTTSLKEPVRIDPALDARVMAEIEAYPAKSRGVLGVIRWLRTGRPLTVTPLGGLAVAASLVVLVVGSRLLFPPTPGSVGGATLGSLSDSAVIQFVIVAQNAGSVSLVGDFNDWDFSATPMQPVRRNGVWSITVPLAPGRYRYAFLVDGETWLADPSAPPAPDSDFGLPGSVVTVGGS
jgi:hypothetical protein